MNRVPWGGRARQQRRVLHTVDCAEAAWTFHRCLSIRWAGDDAYHLVPVVDGRPADRTACGCLLAEARPTAIGETLRCCILCDAAMSEADARCAHCASGQCLDARCQWTGGAI